MLNKFIQVIERKTNERLLINLSHIILIREIKASNLGENVTEDFATVRIKDATIQVQEKYEYFEEFFEENKEEL